jgi:hypothetical protein
MELPDKTLRVFCSTDPVVSVLPELANRGTPEQEFIVSDQALTVGNQ